jgi:hypothetical protein
MDPFISQQDLEDLLGRNLQTDPGALLAIDAACDVVRDLSGQQFNRGTSTVTLDGTGTDALLLPQLPVINAGTVTVNGTAVTNYDVDTERGILFRGTIALSEWTADWPPPTVWTRGRQNVSVTYEHGYANGEVPRSIRFVALSLASRMAVQGLAIQEQQGDVSIRYAVANTDLTNGEKAIIRKYRRNS